MVLEVDVKDEMKGGGNGNNFVQISRVTGGAEPDTNFLPLSLSTF